MFEIAWLAGLLDGRGVVEVGRYYPKGKCKILPDISIDFNVQHKDVAEHASVLMGDERLRPHPFRQTNPGVGGKWKTRAR